MNYTPDFITQLSDNEIFVFGSNLHGMHGGGAARIAHQKFGAEWGIGVGMTGQCYAIPTMHGGIDAIKPYVDDFIDFAISHSELTFLVTKIGCGIAGFKIEDIAPLFIRAIAVDNIILPEEFVRVIESQ
jgi:O-acetyl-ADP-ribose deacetylase (regulator of RNase III)